MLLVVGRDCASPPSPAAAAAMIAVGFDKHYSGRSKEKSKLIIAYDLLLNRWPSSAVLNSSY